MAEPQGPLSFSGVDVHATCFINRDRARKIPGVEDVKSFKKFGELQTISISSARGVAPVRALGETWARAYTKGSRTFAGTLIFSVLETDVFSDIYQLDYREYNTPYSIFADQLPPFTIGLNAINENGKTVSMFLHEVTLTNWGMALSVDDLFIESTYNYVAKWATPFVSGTVKDNIDRFTHGLNDPALKRASDLYQPRAP